MSATSYQYCVCSGCFCGVNSLQPHPIHSLHCKLAVYIIPNIPFHPIEPYIPYVIEIIAATWLSGHGEATRITVFTQEGGKYIFTTCKTAMTVHAAPGS